MAEALMFKAENNAMFLGPTCTQTFRKQQAPTNKNQSTTKALARVL